MIEFFISPVEWERRRGGGVCSDRDSIRFANQNGLASKKPALTDGNGRGGRRQLFVQTQSEATAKKKNRSTDARNTAARSKQEEKKM